MLGQQRIALFIDGANLYATTKTLGFDIDYKRLLKEFQSRGYLVRAFYYTALIEDQEYSSIRPLIDWLDYNGYRVVTKPTKEFVDFDRPAQGQGQHGHRARDRRARARALSSTTWCCSRATAISARSSRRCSAAACACSVVSTISTQPPMVADELRRQADEFMDLAHLIPKIGRDPADRPERPPRASAISAIASARSAPAFRSGGLERRYGIRQAPPATHRRRTTTPRDLRSLADVAADRSARLMDRRRRPVQPCWIAAMEILPRPWNICAGWAGARPLSGTGEGRPTLVPHQARVLAVPVALLLGLALVVQLLAARRARARPSPGRDR